MWTLWRIYDRLQDGTGKLPDGTPIRPLLPLKDRERPGEKDEMHPGYPNFIEGKFGEKPLQPPLGVLKPDGEVTNKPTPLEKANFVENAVPGALDVMAGMTRRDVFSFSRKSWSVTGDWTVISVKWKNRKLKWSLLLSVQMPGTVLSFAPQTSCRNLLKKARFSFGRKQILWGITCTW